MLLPEKLWILKARRRAFGLFAKLYIEHIIKFKEEGGVIPPLKYELLKGLYVRGFFSWK